VKLQNWLTINGLSVHDLAKAVDAAPHTCANWLAGNNVPNRTMMNKIIKLTGGAVRPDEFYDLPMRKAK
jgi:DNA-binding XRE family transcriptional regulator